MWTLRLTGGAYDGLDFHSDEPLEQVLIVWKCSSCPDEHATFDARDPGIVLRTAEAYRRVECDSEQKFAIYEVGEGPVKPEVEEHELVGAGSTTWPGGTPSWDSPWRRDWLNP